jgi:hypothetical protein
LSSNSPGPEGTVAEGTAASAAPLTGAAAAPTGAEQPVPFGVGETLTYDIGWSSYLTAGTATLSVQHKQPSNGSAAYYIVAEGRPTSVVAALYTLYYKVETLLDASSLLPQRGSVFAQEGSRSRMKSTLFNRPAKTATYEVKTATLVTKELTVPDRSQDVLSALYVLRSMPLKSGETFIIPVSDNGNVYDVRMTVGGTETVATGMGTIDAIRVTPVIRDPEGLPAGRAMAIWLSNDARRLPVRMEAQLAVGKFTIILQQAQ